MYGTCLVESPTRSVFSTPGTRPGFHVSLSGVTTTVPGGVSAPMPNGSPSERKRRQSLQEHCAPWCPPQSVQASDAPTRANLMNCLLSFSEMPADSICVAYWHGISAASA